MVISQVGCSNMPAKYIKGGKKQYAYIRESIVCAHTKYFYANILFSLLITFSMKCLNQKTTSP